MKSALSDVLVVEPLLLDASGHVVHLPGVVHDFPFLFCGLHSGRVVGRHHGQHVLHHGHFRCPRGDHQVPWLLLDWHVSEVATC